MMMTYDVARYLRVAAMALSAFPVSAPALYAQPPRWHYRVTQYGIREAFVDAKATGLGEHCSTRLKFWVSPDIKSEAEGSLALDLTFSPVHSCSFKGFDFDSFVDETGPGKQTFTPDKQTLIRVTVFKGGKRLVRSFAVYGLYEYSTEKFAGYTGMTFETNNLIDDKQSPLRKLVDQLLKGADRIEIAVIDGRNHARVLSVKFPLAGSKPHLAALFKGL